MNQAIDVSMDGIDPDAPQNRHGRSYRYPEAANMVDDLQELKLLDEADLRRYSGKA